VTKKVQEQPPEKLLNNGRGVQCPRDFHQFILVEVQRSDSPK